MEIAEISTTETTTSQIHVILKDGTTMVVAASSFKHQLNPEDLILFYDEEDNLSDKIFMRASAVDCIVADAALVEMHPFVKLQNQVYELRGLVNSILTRLGEIESAVKP
jgi:hypothetical protein